MRIRTRLLLTATLVCALAAGALAGPDPETLIGDLGGADETARSLARQLLPRLGVGPVDDILPLLERPDPTVSWAARNVLADIANEVAVAGREDERRQAADALTGLVAPGKPEQVRIWGLELLAVAVPEGYDVAPVAALLGEPALRDRAREALELMGTTEARAALRGALDGADPEMQCALLRSLERLRDGSGLDTFRTLAAGDDGRVRVAAVRALAWAGHPQDADLATRVYDTADKSIQGEAADALVRLADAMVVKAESTARAVAAYRHVLDTAPAPHLRGMAVTGLIRHGGRGAQEVVVAALTDDRCAEIELPALSAFEHTCGEDANALIRAVYPRVSPEMQAQLLGVCGRKGDPALFDLVVEAAGSDHAALRDAARDALADSRLAGAAAALEKMARNSPAARASAVAALERMAETCRIHGPAEVAGEAFVSLHRLADTPERRAAALKGMMQFPSPEAFGAVTAALEQGDLGSSAVPTLCALATSLRKQGRTDEADRAVELVLAQVRTPEDMAALMQAAPGDGAIPDLARRLGFITRWQVVGPFPWNMSDGFAKAHIGEPAVDPQATFTAGNAVRAWKPAEVGDPSGIVNLSDFLGAGSECVGYGLARVTVPEATDVVIKAGSDDGIKVWVNGEAVHENNVNRGTAVDQDQAPAKLRAGDNAILVAITQGGGGWNYCLRLTRPDGTPLTFDNPEP